MHLCRNDALMQLLNQLGYQPLMMPRTDVEPPELYVFSNDRLVRRGPLADYLPEGLTIPPLRHGELPDIQQTVTSGKSTQAAASFLESALRCIGVLSAPKLDLQFTHGRTMAFSFNGVTSSSLDPSKLDHLLSELRTGAIPQEQLEDGLLLVHEYASAETLVMREAAGTSGRMDVRALDLDDLFNLGGGATVSVHDDTALRFTPKTGKPVVFAAKIGRIERQKRIWRFFPEEIMGQGLTANEGDGKPYLVHRGAILDVHEDG